MTTEIIPQTQTQTQPASVFVVAPADDATFWQRFTDRISQANNGGPGMPGPKEDEAIWKKNSTKKQRSYRVDIWRRDDGNLVLAFYLIQSGNLRTKISKALAKHDTDYDRPHGGSWQTQFDAENYYQEWVTEVRGILAEAA